MKKAYPYEQLTSLSPAKAVKRADSILEDGWTRRGQTALDLSEPIPWALPDQTLRSWNFHIHSFDMIDPLLAAYSQTTEEKYLIPALAIALDWVKKHPRQAQTVSPMAWYDMAVGLRSYRLGYIYEASDNAGLLDADTSSALWTSLVAHRIELEDDANISFHNNHGYYQVAGQLALGRRFKDVSPHMAALYTQGVHRLRRILDQQFGPDGVHREHSPDYHRMVADTLLGLVRAGLVEDNELLGRVDGIEEALAWFITPDGLIANFGDSDCRNMIHSSEGASRKWTTPLMRAVASNGAAGSGWPRGMKEFADSGYVVVRTPNLNTPEINRRDTYLAQTAAFHSRTHKHCDDLSFIWHECGQALLVDAGRYGYIGKTKIGSDQWKEGFWYSDPMRIFMESSRAHNTLEFDGRNALRKGVKPYGSAIVNTAENNGVFCIETRCKQHNAIWHDRLLILKPARWLVVFDVFTDNLKEPHDVCQWFHLAPGHKAHPVDNGYNVHTQEGGQLTIRGLIDSPAVGPVITGQKNDPLQGWFSDNERSVQPADALSFRQYGKYRGVFATLLTLSAAIEFQSDTARSNITGRKANLSWVDGNGRHRVAFDRTNGLTLTYEASPMAHLPLTKSARGCETYLSNAKRVLVYNSKLAHKAVALTVDAQIIFTCKSENETVSLKKELVDWPERLTVYVEGPRPDLNIWNEDWFKDPDAIMIEAEQGAQNISQILDNIKRPTTIIWMNFKHNPRWQEWTHVIDPIAELDDALIFSAHPTPNL